jgi:uncharacterized membrane protein
MIETPAAVLATLAGIAAFWFWMEQVTGWKLFQFMVPLLWIYATPMVLRNVGVLPAESATYDALRQFGLPMFVVLLLLAVDVGSAVRVMGRGIGVMLLGTAGVVVGAPVGYLAVRHWLDPEAWRGFGALAGSWIGGTGNLAAAAAMLDTPPEQFGLAVLADNVVYVVWLPMLLLSKHFADRFNRWTGVSAERLSRMDAAAQRETREKVPPRVQHLLYLGALAAGVTWLASWLAPQLPEIEPVLSTSTWTVLLVTTLGIALSFTPARRLPSSHELGMAIVYLFVARMGATASLDGLSQAPAFLLGAFIWILIHGLFCLGGAWLFKVDVHSAAIASAANIGGAASVPVVAAYHRESLVPAGILMALIGYALGNYLAWVTGILCSWVA